MVWKFSVKDPAGFDRFKAPKDIGPGVQVTYARVKGTERWDIQNFLFSKKRFHMKAHVRAWLEKHLKTQATSMLDHRAFNEYRRRSLAVYIEYSEMKL